jgi:hypothetical protein
MTPDEDRPKTRQELLRADWRLKYDAPGHARGTVKDGMYWFLKFNFYPWDSPDFEAVKQDGGDSMIWSVKPRAFMHADGRVVSAATKEAAQRDGGAMLSSLSGHDLPLYDQAAIDSALSLWPRDCRMCAHYTTKSGGCRSVVQCVDAIQFKATAPHQYWRRG